MDVPLFCQILQRTLLPFIQEKFPAPSTHRFMQDNDPKYCSHYAQHFYEENGVNWWHTPPESLDLNPIENVWHKHKEYLCREINPQTKVSSLMALHNSG